MMLKCTEEGSSVRPNEGSHLAPGLFDFSYCILYGHEEAPATPYYAFYINGCISVEIEYGVVYATMFGNSEVTISAAKLINDGKRHLITITCNRTWATGFRLYIDGELADVGDPTPNMSYSFDFSGPESVQFLTGEIDSYISQFRAYVGRVLTAEQIQAIWNNGAGIRVDEDEMAALLQGSEDRWGWYAEFEDGEGMTFSGRYFHGSWIDSNGTLTGQFEWVEGGIPFTATVDASAGDNGSISPAGEVAVVYGQDQEFTATPDPGYQVNQWSLDNNVIHSGGSNHIIKTITANHELVVTFATPQSLFLCTLADIKDRLGIASDKTEDDTTINSIIQGVSEIFNNETGRILLQPDTDVTEYYTGSGPHLQLRRYPVISITSIRESPLYTFGDDSLLTPNEDYRVISNGKKGIIYRVGFEWSQFEDAIEVIYRGGFCPAGQTPGENEVAVPADLREAAIEQISFLFQRRLDLGLSGQGFMGGSISKFSAVDLLPIVKEVLKKYRRPSL